MTKLTPLTCLVLASILYSMELQAESECKQKYLFVHQLKPIVKAMNEYNPDFPFFLPQGKEIAHQQVGFRDCEHIFSNFVYNENGELLTGYVYYFDENGKYLRYLHSPKSKNYHKAKQPANQ